MDFTVFEDGFALWVYECGGVVEPAGAVFFYVGACVYVGFVVACRLFCELDGGAVGVFCCLRVCGVVGVAYAP